MTTLKITFPLESAHTTVADLVRPIRQDGKNFWYSSVELDGYAFELRSYKRNGNAEYSQRHAHTILTKVLEHGRKEGAAEAQQRIVKLEATTEAAQKLLARLDFRGGLGIDIHREIREILAFIDKH